MSRKHKILAVNILFLLVAIFVAVNSEIVTAKETEDGWVYNYTEDGNNVVICGYNGDATDITIPESVDGKEVTKINYAAFAGCENIIKISIPSGVSRIEDYCFWNCVNLENIIIPESVSDIGILAFEGTKWLDNQINNSTDGLIIVNNVLVDASKATGTIIVPENVKSISGKAFMGCAGDFSVVLPEGVENIGNNCFSDANNLTSVVIPNSVTSIGEHAFEQCEKLNNIILPDSVLEIGGLAFFGCSSLTEIVIPDKVTTIPFSAFLGCDNLEKITIPDTVSYIGERAFEDTKWLDNKRAENPLVIINGMVVDGITCQGDVVIPEGTKKICESAFENSASYADNENKERIKSITIPDSVVDIGQCAFDNCGKNTVFYASKDSYAYGYVSGLEDYGYILMTPEDKDATDKDPTPDDNTNNNTGDDSQIGNQNGSTNGNGQNGNSDGGKQEGKNNSSSSNGNSNTGNQGTDNQGQSGTKTSTDTKKDEKTGLSIGTVTSYNNIRYKVDGEDTVSVQGYDNKKVSSITIPNKVSFNNKEYTVASINKQSFANNKKLKKITIGANVTSIKPKAFLGCKNLKTIVIKSKKIKSIGSKAFKGINKKATLYVPKSLKKKDYSKYKKMLKKAGVSKSVKIKKK